MSNSNFECWLKDVGVFKAQIASKLKLHKTISIQKFIEHVNDELLIGVDNELLLIWVEINIENNW